MRLEIHDELHKFTFCRSACHECTLKRNCILVDAVRLWKNTTRKKKIMKKYYPKKKDFEKKQRKKHVFFYYCTAQLLKKFKSWGRKSFYAQMKQHLQSNEIQNIIEQS
jgi:hypothetical protein